MGLSGSLSKVSLDNAASGDAKSSYEIARLRLSEEAVLVDHVPAESIRRNMPSTLIDRSGGGPWRSSGASMLIVGAFKGFNFPPFRLPLELARRWKSLLSSLVAESTMFASGGCCRTSSPAPDAACLYFLFRRLFEVTVLGSAGPDDVRMSAAVAATSTRCERSSAQDADWVRSMRGLSVIAPEGRRGSVAGNVLVEFNGIASGALRCCSAV